MIVQATTYLKNQSYTFFPIFDHTIPAGGSLVISLPATGEISLSSLSTCSMSLIHLQCQSNSTAITVLIDSTNFPKGVANNTLQIKITGFRNPRALAPTGSFILTSYDQSGFRIDSSTLDNFNATMTSAANFTSFTVYIDNKTNGAISNYIISFILPTPVISSDSLSIQFPVEI